MDTVAFHTRIPRACSFYSIRILLLRGEISKHSPSSRGGSEKGDPAKRSLLNDLKVTLVLGRSDPPFWIPLGGAVKRVGNSPGNSTKGILVCDLGLRPQSARASWRIFHWPFDAEINLNHPCELQYKQT